MRVESRNLGFGIRNTAQGIRNPTDKESGIQYFESEIHGEESRTQDCLGFPYMEDGGGTKRTQERKKMRLDKEDMKISKISLKGKNFRNLITFMRKKKRKIVEKEIAHLHFYFGQCDKMLSNVSSNQRSKL